MKQKLPSAFELAQLAVMLDATPKNMVDQRKLTKRAFGYWQSAQWHLDYIVRPQEQKEYCAQQLKELTEGIFKFSKAEWHARIEDYRGDLDEIQHAICDKHFPLSEVHKILYPDKSLTKAQRAKMFSELPKFAAKHNIPWGPVLGELDITNQPTMLDNENVISGMKLFLSMDPLSGDMCRWAFEVRLAQISNAKKRLQDD